MIMATCSLTSNVPWQPWVWVVWCVLKQELAKKMFICALNDEHVFSLNVCATQYAPIVCKRKKKCFIPHATVKGAVIAECEELFFFFSGVFICVAVFGRIFLVFFFCLLLACHYFIRSAFLLSSNKS